MAAVYGDGTCDAVARRVLTQRRHVAGRRRTRQQGPADRPLVRVAEGAAQGRPVRDVLQHRGRARERRRRSPPGARTARTRPTCTRRGTRRGTARRAEVDAAHVARAVRECPPSPSTRPRPAGTGRVAAICAATTGSWSCSTRTRSSCCPDGSAVGAVVSACERRERLGRHAERRPGRGGYALVGREQGDRRARPRTARSRARPPSGPTAAAGGRRSAVRRGVQRRLQPGEHAHRRPFNVSSPRLTRLRTTASETLTAAAMSL